MSILRIGRAGQNRGVFSNPERVTLSLLVLAFVALALAWNLAVPPYENLDEIEHFEVIRHIAVTGRLPSHYDAEAEGFHVGQEASQPPLYHILGAVWIRVWGLSRAALPIAPMPDKVVACGPSDTFYNKATWVHDPYRVVSPTRYLRQDPRFTLHMLRLFSTLLQVATLLGAWTLARRVFLSHLPGNEKKLPGRWRLPALVTAIVAFNPQFLLVAAGVNNDNLITPLAIWALVLAFDLVSSPTANSSEPSKVGCARKGEGPALAVSRFGVRLILYGGLSGLAALSKLSGLGLIGLGGVVLLARAWRPQRPWRERISFRDLLGWSVLMMVPVLLIVTPWIIRNLRLYGDPTALTPMLAIVGRRTPPPVFGEVRLMLLSYWGQLPCSFYPRAIYWPYLLLMTGGAVGLLVEIRARWMDLRRGGGWRSSISRRVLNALGIAACWFLIILVAWMRWNSITPAPGGRLLFPASAGVALLLAVGWYRLILVVCSLWLPSPDAVERSSWAMSRLIAACLPLWALVTLRAGPIEIFAPPPLLPEEGLGLKPFTFGPQALESGANPSQSGAAHLYSDQPRIVTPRFACAFASSTYCNPSLNIELLWQVKEPFSRNWTLAIQLVSPVPGDTTLRLNYNHWPGHGNLPTSAWPSSMAGSRASAPMDGPPLMYDPYLLPIPDAHGATQAWNVHVALFDLESGERLPVHVDGQPVGDGANSAAHIATLRVPGENPLCPEQGALALPPRLGAAVDLKAAVVEPSDAEWQVTLCWESVAALAEDYTVFVHAYNTEGELLATGDGPPMRGAFPTRLWVPGDRILDVHEIPHGVWNDKHEDELPVLIAVGLYHPISGERLPVVRGEERLLNDAIPIWEGGTH